MYMPVNNPPKVKICCISSMDEAKMAIHAGASALGLVGHMPSGPGVISDEQITQIARIIPPPIASFLLTSFTDVPSIIALQRKVRTNTIQIVDELKSGSYDDLRENLPGIHLVQVIHVMGEQSIEEALRVAPKVDAILLDSGNPTLQVKELGGTGRVHNWEISREIRESIPIPLFLAGGLHAGNVQEAIQTVQPFGVDICSSVRTHGKLDITKLQAFMQAVNG